MTRTALLIRTVALLALCGGAFVTGAKAAPAPGTLVIMNSGSTNGSGDEIAVLPGGQMVYTNGTDVRNVTLPPELAKKLFDDVQAAQPFAQLALPRCMKSASFGSKTILMYGNETSPDISCPGNPKAMTLYGDVQAIQQAEGISILPRRQFPAPFVKQGN